MTESLQDLNFLHLYYFWAAAREGGISAACERLQLSQPTISMQIRKLEKSLGHKLFQRTGRGLALTEMGQTVFDYADEIFAMGRELMGTLRGMPSGSSAKLMVGVPKAMPKMVAYRLLEPVLHLPEHVHIVCREGDFDQLLADMGRHRYDVIISDTPVRPDERVRTFNHALGESGVSICATAALATHFRRRFPKSLDGAPFLLPTAGTDMRRALDRWFDSQKITPRIVAEFDDSALLKEFGHAGAGLFPVPSAVLSEVKRQYSVELVGKLSSVRLKFYAITTERKLKHPAVVAISENARYGVLADAMLELANGTARD
jgi:LysR family transcriptional activator of nhaA